MKQIKKQKYITNEDFRLIKLIFSSQIIGWVIYAIFYIFSLFPPDASIFLRLIPIYILILIPLFLVIFGFIKRKSSSAKIFISGSIRISQMN